MLVSYPGPGALFWGENQQQMEDRGERNDYGRGNVEHSRFSMSGLFEIIEVSQGQYTVNTYTCISCHYCSMSIQNAYINAYM